MYDKQKTLIYNTHFCRFCQLRIYNCIIINDLDIMKRLLRENNEWSDDLARFESGWEYIENTEGIDYSSNEEYTVIHVPGGVVTSITESGGEIVIPTYRSEVYRKIKPVPNPEFHYQDLLGIGINVESNTLS